MFAAARPPDVLAVLEDCYGTVQIYRGRSHTDADQAVRRETAVFSRRRPRSAGGDGRRVLARRSRAADGPVLGGVMARPSTVAASDGLQWTGAHASSSWSPHC